MTPFDRIFGRNGHAHTVHIIPSQLTAKEFGKVEVRRSGDALQVRFTILMEPQGREAEGWQTGVALDASASMKTWYGRELQGTVPQPLVEEYIHKGWVSARIEDGRSVRVFQHEAHQNAIRLGHLRVTENIVEPLAREFIAYLAGEIDVDGRSTVLYCGCDDGAGYEVVGDFTEEQCRKLELNGPADHAFGLGTRLAPALRYLVDRFDDAARGMFVFITDGRLDDLDDVKHLTTHIARDIAEGKRNPLRCVLIGVGDEIDESQLHQLSTLDTGTDVDIWDHKNASEMRALIEIFADVVTEKQIVAPAGIIYDAGGHRIWKSTDGMPARVAFTMPAASPYFELEVAGRRIRQSVVL
jgi:hypothetical protein